MLVKFEFENVKTFKEDILWFSSKDKNNKNVIVKDNRLKLNKINLIYGPNLSGKDHILSILQLFKYILNNNDVRDINPSNITDIDKQIYFNIHFYVKEVLYMYIIIIKSGEVIYESLYQCKNDKSRITYIFYRQDGKIKFNKEYKHIQYLSNHIDDYELVLPGLKHIDDTLGDTYNYISRDILLYNMSGTLDFDELLNTSDKFNKNFIEMMYSLDLGYTEDDVRKLLVNSKHPQSRADYNATRDNNIRRIIKLVSILINSVLNNKTIFIDNFDLGLHSSVTKYLVEFIMRHNIQATLVVNDTSLMRLCDLGEISEEQIWIVDKDKYGASELYSLAAFNNIKKLDNKEGSYLMGKFGGVPYLKEFNMEV